MSKEIFDKMPESVRGILRSLKNDYSNARGDIINREIARTRSYWYIKGLLDAKYITDSERQFLLNYILED